MITVFLSGGLGNQLFQYASGKVLAERTGSDLLIDLSLLNIRTKNTTPRNYELNHFILDKDIKITSSKLKGFLISKLYFNIRHTSLGKKITKYFSIFTGSYDFDPLFSQLRNKLMLIEYFLPEKYLSNYKYAIQNSFTLKGKLCGKNNELETIIQSVNAVSIHIRRGDYISNQNAANHFTTCSEDYYEQAIAYMCERVKSPKFFVFSDEPEKAKELLHTKDAVYVNWNDGEKSYIDMRLMSLCRHNIIANSSFSWWGAWLNNYPEKIVIAPHKWFKNETRNDNIKNLLPQEWIKL